MPALRPPLLFDPTLQKAEAAHWRMARMPVLQRPGFEVQDDFAAKNDRGISSIRPFRKLKLRTRGWHECQCCNDQVSKCKMTSQQKHREGEFSSKRTHQLLVPM